MKNQLGTDKVMNLLMNMLNSGTDTPGSSSTSAPQVFNIYFIWIAFFTIISTEWELAGINFIIIFFFTIIIIRIIFHYTTITQVSNLKSLNLKLYNNGEDNVIVYVKKWWILWITSFQSYCSDEGIKGTVVTMVR